MFGLSIALLAIAMVVALLGITAIVGGAFGASQIALMVLALLLAIGAMIIFWKRSPSR